MIDQRDSVWRLTRQEPQEDHKRENVPIWRAKAEELREPAMGMQDVAPASC